MQPRNPTEYVREKALVPFRDVNNVRVELGGTILALRDVSLPELLELYQLLSERLGDASKVSLLRVCGAIERREYETEPDNLSSMFGSWVDVWENTKQSGECAYLICRRINDALEEWGQAKPGYRHVTMHLGCPLPRSLEDSLYKSGLFASLSKLVMEGSNHLANFTN